MIARTKSDAFSRATSRSSMEEHEADQLYISVGRYRNTLVAIKKVHRPKLDVDRALMHKMRQVGAGRFT